MRWIETIFAALMLTICVVLLVRMALPPARRARLDAAFGRWRRRLAHGADRLGAAVRRPTAEARARRETAAAIRRARERAESGEWDGNVYRPKSFKRKKRDLH